MPGFESQLGESRTAVIVQDPAAPPEALLTNVLEQAGFWSHLEATSLRAGVLPPELRILILPDLEFFSADAPTYTDPRLVEHLMDLLHTRGYCNVTVGSAPNQWLFWTENRDVPVLADLAGYRYETPAGRPYDFADLSEETIADRFPSHSVLRGSDLSLRWSEAHFRINFAKNKTDEANAFALGVQNLLSLLPLRDKTLHYQHRLPAPEVATALLRTAPPHFTLIDAIASNHGCLGSRAPHPLATHSIIASASPLLADWAASLRMGIDPFASPLNAHALREIGLPPDYRIVGSLAPYEGWMNVPPLVLDSARKRDASATFGRLVQPWFQQLDPALFPFKEMLHERANAFATKYLGAAGSDNAALLASIGVNYLIAASHSSSEAMRVVFAKHQLPQREAGLGFDANSYTLEDYEAVAPYMEQWEEIIAHTPPDANGLRWRYIDGSILFSMSCTLPVPFESWCERVEIAKSVQSMNDYIGGACVPVQRDALGRVTHQAERNIYLPQPNWMAFFGGEFIDVCKLEHVRYGTDAHRIYWRTIKSLNSSADFDDGIVAFTRAGEAATQVSIVARQKFALPLFWQAINMDLLPSIKSILVAHAYENYFRGTLRNFEAQYEGRPYRIGRPWPAGDRDEPTPGGLEALLGLIGLQPADIEKYAGVIRGARGERAPSAAAPAAILDEHGFRHFGGANGRGDVTDPVAKLLTESRSFLTGLAEAVRKDLGLHQER